MKDIQVGNSWQLLSLRKDLPRSITKVLAYLSHTCLLRYANTTPKLLCREKPLLKWIFIESDCIAVCGNSLCVRDESLYQLHDTVPWYGEGKCSSTEETVWGSNLGINLNRRNPRSENPSKTVNDKKMERLETQQAIHEETRGTRVRVVANVNKAVD